MEKIIFDEKTFIYKTRLDLSEFKDEILAECKVLCDKTTTRDAIKDTFSSIPLGENELNILSDINAVNFIDSIDLTKIEISTKLDEIAQFGIRTCVNLYQSEINSSYDKVYSDNWVGVLVAQDNSRIELLKTPNFHSHYETNKLHKRFVPFYTYVYYIQMPNKLKGNYGVLDMKSDEHSVQYSILPEEGDLIIMPGDMLHRPNWAFGSDKNRVLFAGNVGFNPFSDEI